MRVSFDMSKFQDDCVDLYMFSNVALLVWGQQSKAIKLKEKRTWKSFIGKHSSVRRLREICDLWFAQRVKTDALKHTLLYAALEEHVWLYTKLDGQLYLQTQMSNYTSQPYDAKQYKYVHGS